MRASHFILASARMDARGGKAVAETRRTPLTRGNARQSGHGLGVSLEVCTNSGLEPERAALRALEAALRQKEPKRNPNRQQGACRFQGDNGVEGIRSVFRSF